MTCVSYLTFLNLSFLAWTYRNCVTCQVVMATKGKILYDVLRQWLVQRIKSLPSPYSCHQALSTSKDTHVLQDILMLTSHILVAAGFSCHSQQVHPPTRAQPHRFVQQYHLCRLPQLKEFPSWQTLPAQVAPLHEAFPTISLCNDLTSSFRIRHLNPWSSPS